MRGKPSVALVLALGASLAWTGAALADPDKDESGKGRERTVEFREGGCTIERKLGRDGYEEKRKCGKEARREGERERDETRRAAREPELEPRVRERPGAEDLPWLRERRAETIPPPVPRPTEPSAPSIDPPIQELPPPPSSRSAEPPVWENPE